jgi:hypothetical protein
MVSSLSSTYTPADTHTRHPEDQKLRNQDWAKPSSTGKQRRTIPLRSLSSYVPVHVIVYTDTPQYTLDEANPLASVTHERDLDEFLSSAALANTDFTTGESGVVDLQAR